MHDVARNVATAQLLDRWGFPLDPRRVEPVPVHSKPSKAVKNPRYGRYSALHRQVLQRLALLCAARRPHQTFSNREIARACGLSAEGVNKIVRSALKKLRARLPKECRDEFAQLLARDRVPGRTKPRHHA